MTPMQISDTARSAVKWINNHPLQSVLIVIGWLLLYAVVRETYFGGK